jgi:hypothetical protein
MRLHLNHRSAMRAVWITFVALLLGLGTLAPSATADILSPVDEARSGERTGSVSNPQTPNELSIKLIDSLEPAPPVVLSENLRQIQRIEGLLPESAFADDESSEYCYRCFSYR